MLYSKYVCPTVTNYYFYCFVRRALFVIFIINREITRAATLDCSRKDIPLEYREVINIISKVRGKRESQRTCSFRRSIPFDTRDNICLGWPRKYVRRIYW